MTDRAAALLPLVVLACLLSACDRDVPDDPGSEPEPLTALSGPAASATATTPTSSDDGDLEGADYLVEIAQILRPIADVFDAELHGAEIAPVLEGTALALRQEARGGFDELARDAETHQIERFVLLAFEYEIIFYAGSRPLYYLQTTIAPLDEARFARISGQPKHRIVLPGVAPEHFSGGLAPIRVATSTFLEALRSETTCRELPLVDPEVFASHVDRRDVAESMAGIMPESRAFLSSSCAGFSDLGEDRIEIRFDDVSLLAYDRAGHAVGLLKTGVTPSPDGTRLEIDRGRFRAFD